MVLGCADGTNPGAWFFLLSSYRDGRCRELRLWALLDRMSGPRSRCRPSRWDAGCGCRGDFLSWTARPDRRAGAGDHVSAGVREGLAADARRIRGYPLAVLEQRAFAMDHRELCSGDARRLGLPRVFHQPAFLRSSPTNRAVCRGLAGVCNGSLLHLSSFVAEIFVAEEAERPILVAVCSR